MIGHLIWYGLYRVSAFHSTSLCVSGQLITVGSDAHVQAVKQLDEHHVIHCRKEQLRESTCVPCTWCASFNCGLACT